MEENNAVETGEKKQSKAMTEAIYKELSIINGKINRMNSDELIRKLKHYHLDTEGSDEVRRKRLKSHYKKIKLASADVYLSNKLFPYYVIVDFEATCEPVNPPNYRHEIIEFPAVIVNSKTQEIEDTFQMFCKPVINPKLTSFCTELTGITQEQVDSADSFENVLKIFESWLKDHKLVSKNKFVIVTDGPWDMSRFLYGQCQYSKVDYPKWGIEWVNLRKTFSNFYKCKRFCLKSMLEHVGMGFEGRPHCGLDDAKNIARILIRMMCDGADLLINEKITKNNKLKPDKVEEEKINFEGNWNDDMNKKMKSLRLEARFTSVNYQNPPPTYSRVKRERSIFEAKVAKQISQDESSEKEELTEEINEWIPVTHSRFSKKKFNNSNNKKKKKKRY